VLLRSASQWRPVESSMCSSGAGDHLTRPTEYRIIAVAQRLVETSDTTGGTVMW
jgi:hypothetical protein